jgi:hypothetical protein
MKTLRKSLLSRHTDSARFELERVLWTFYQTINKLKFTVLQPRYNCFPVCLRGSQLKLAARNLPRDELFYDLEKSNFLAICSIPKLSSARPPFCSTLRARAHTHTLIVTHVHTYIHTLIVTHTHARTHTHTHTHSSTSECEVHQTAVVMHRQLKSLVQAIRM